MHQARWNSPASSQYSAHPSQIIMGGGRVPALILCLVSIFLFSTLLPLLLLVHNSLTMATPSWRCRQPMFILTESTNSIGRDTLCRLASGGHALLVHRKRDRLDLVITSLVRDLEGPGALHIPYLCANLGDLEQAVAALQSW